MNRISTTASVVASVRGEEREVIVLCELVVDREVPEVEERVAHAGVLPVDEPEALAVVDEVRVQQVVVTRTERRARAAALDLVRDLLRALVCRWHAGAASGRDVAVGLDDAKAVEAAWYGGAVVQQPKRGSHPFDLDVPDLAFHVAHDEIALRFDEGDHLWCESEFGGTR